MSILDPQSSSAAPHVTYNNGILVDNSKYYQQRISIFHAAIDIVSEQYKAKLLHEAPTTEAILAEAKKIEEFIFGAR